jgi:hypothetical protein
MRLLRISQMQHAGGAIGIELDRAHADIILTIDVLKPKAKA